MEVHRGEIDAFAKKLIEETPSRSGATVIALSGDLGAGKTALTQAIARVLGVDEKVPSPTFLVMRSYKTAHERFRTLVHVDAYRIEEEKELEVLGIPTLLTDPHTLLCVEWPENVPSLIPADAVRVKIEQRGEEVREITLG